MVELIKRHVSWGGALRRIRKSGLSIAALAFPLLGMCACSALPDSGPSAQEIAIQANAADYPRYEVVDIDPLVVASLRHKGWDSFSARFGDRRISSEPVIGIGDSVTVTIWEASSGGLFSAPVVTDRISVGSNSAMIPEQVVGRDGGVTVPYAGRIHVAGKTTRAVQTAIEHALEGKAIQPQVLVNVTRPISNSVSRNSSKGPLSCSLIS